MPQPTDEFSPEERANARDLMRAYAAEVRAREEAAAAAAARAARLAAKRSAIAARQARLRSDAAAAGGYGAPGYADIVRVGDAEVAALEAELRSI